MTLNKADKDYSPTTMYTITPSREPVPLAEPEHYSGGLSHWAAIHSPPGARQQSAAVCPGVQGGPAHRRCSGLYLPGNGNYVKHDGSRPMNITWQLDRPIPAKFLKKTNKLVVG